jgi:hypothetical protein
MKEKSSEVAAGSGAQRRAHGGRNGQRVLGGIGIVDRGRVVAVIDDSALTSKLASIPAMIWRMRCSIRS